MPLPAQTLAALQVVRLYSIDFTRCVEVDIEHGAELSAATWGRGACHFSQGPADDAPHYGSVVTLTDLAGAHRFISECRAENDAVYLAKKDALYALYAPINSEQREVA